MKIETKFNFDDNVFAIEQSDCYVVPCKACEGVGHITLKNNKDYECPECYGNGRQWEEGDCLWRVSGEALITDIEISTHYYCEASITYETAEGCSYAEEDCFATTEEAQAECDRRNNE